MLCWPRARRLSRRHLMRKSFVLIILAAGVLAGCGGGSSAKLSPDDVAVVGSTHVTTADLDVNLNRAKIG